MTLLRKVVIHKMFEAFMAFISQCLVGIFTVIGLSECVIHVFPFIEWLESTSSETLHWIRHVTFASTIPLPDYAR